MDPVQIMMRAWERIGSVISSPISALTFLVGHILVFPIDCLFLLYDILAVNWRKLGLFGADCRDMRGSCGSAAKYTNKWMFRLFVCPKVRRHEDSAHFSCGAPGRRTQPIRGLLGLLFLAALLITGLGIVMFAGEEETTKEPEPQQGGEVIAESLQRADTAFAEEDYATALTYYKKLLGLDPRNKKALYRAGFCLEQDGQIKRARLHYRQAISGTGGLPQAAARLALSHYRAGAVARAGSFAEKALAMGNDSAVVQAIVAESSLLSGETEDAVRFLKTAVEKQPDDPIVMSARAKVLLARGQIQQVAELMANTENPPTLPTWRLCEAELLWKHGKPMEASRKLESFLFEHPQWHNLRVVNVGILLSAGRVREALKKIERMRGELALPYPYILAVALSLRQYGQPDHALEIALDLTREQRVRPRAHLLAAEIYLDKGVPLRAAHHSEAALTLRPNNARGHVLAGRTRLRQGKTAEAREFFEKAVEMAPNSAEAHYFLGKAHVQSGETERAAPELRQACNLAPNKGMYHLYHGRALVSTGKNEEADAAFQKAASLLPDPHSAYTHLGWLAKQRGDREQAFSYYQKAIAANPSRAAVAYHNLALMLLPNRRHVPLALAMAHTAQAISPPRNRPETSGTLADALVRAGYTRMALPAARIAARLHPDEDQRQLTLGLAEAAAGHREEAVGALEQAMKLADRPKDRKRIQGIIESLSGGTAAGEADGTDGGSEK